MDRWKTDLTIALSLIVFFSGIFMSRLGITHYDLLLVRWGITVNLIGLLGIVLIFFGLLYKEAKREFIKIGKEDLLEQYFISYIAGIMGGLAVLFGGKSFKLSNDWVLNALSLLQSFVHFVGLGTIGVVLVLILRRWWTHKNR
ncbi:hypothetical protein [Geoglobus acetivorans]|uniref:hypothetical protein n=1 Tax=Geoglobus acetivorans TaxID=565033 RepID=UPI00064E937C